MSEKKNTLDLTEGLEMAKGKNIGLIICILPDNLLDYHAEPRIIEIYGNAEWGEEIEEEGIYNIPFSDRVTEMERRGYKLCADTYVVFPARNTGGLWQSPYIKVINLNNPWVWMKDGKVWIDTEGITT